MLRLSTRSLLKDAQQRFGVSEIYQKTVAAQAALAPGGAPLTQQEKALLIMIDGKKSVADLSRFAAAFGDMAALCDRLMSLGLIEAVPGAAPAQASAAAGPANQVKPSDAADGERFSPQRVRAVVRLLNDTVGVRAETICLELERCKTADRFDLLCAQAVQALNDYRRPADAQRLAQLLAN
jgi:hypothetical protein